MRAILGFLPIALDAATAPILRRSAIAETNRTGENESKSIQHATHESAI
jgi:hypothetical protein